MNESEIRERLRVEHEKNWLHAKACAEFLFEEEPDRTDREVARSLERIGLRMCGVVDAAEALGVDLERLREIDPITVRAWREGFQNKQQEKRRENRKKLRRKARV